MVDRRASPAPRRYARVLLALLTGAWLLVEGGTSLGNAADAVYQTVDEITIDLGNTSAYAAKERAVDGAQKSIAMQYFLFSDDFAGASMALKLIEKARQGVHVRLLVDAKMTMGQAAFFGALVKAGAPNLEVAYFRPLPPDVTADLNAMGFDDFGALAKRIATGDPAELFKMIDANPVLRSSEARTERVRAFFGAFLGGVIDDEPADVADVITDAHGHDSTLEALGARLTSALREAFPGAPFNARSWFDLTKLNHHKLLVVDGEYVQGGGRNLEAEYHWEKDDPLRARHAIEKPPFMDADYVVRDAGLARAALTTFDSYWACATDASCSAGIPVALAKPTFPDRSDTVIGRLSRRAAEWAETRPYARTYRPIHAGRFTSHNAPVAYVENRMFPGAEPTGLFPEERSLHAAEFIRLADRVGAGEEIILHNAYLFLPASVQAALVRALNRGARLLIQTNSRESSDLGFIAKNARVLYEQLLARWPQQVEIYEYTTDESLHVKTWIVGDHIIIGSVNADPRCEWLDTGNSVAIGPASEGLSMAQQYKTWLADLRAELLVDHERARSGLATALRRLTPQTLEKYRLDRDKEVAALPEPRHSALTKLRALIDATARESFEDSAAGDNARRRLERLFLQY